MIIRFTTVVLILLLALGVLPGWSQSITYGVTSGTDISTQDGGTASDNAVSEAFSGTAATVTAASDMSFELAKKVAITVHNGTEISANTIFDPVRIKVIPSVLSLPLNQDPISGGSNLANTYLVAGIGVYANTEINIAATSSSSFTHATDAGSIIEGACSLITYHLNGIEINRTEDLVTQDCTTPINIPVATLHNNQYTVDVEFWRLPYIDTMDATDRAGTYTSTAVIEISSL